MSTNDLLQRGRGEGVEQVLHAHPDRFATVDATEQSVRLWKEDKTQRELSNFARHGTIGFRPRWSIPVGDDWKTPDDRNGNGNKSIRTDLMVR